MRALVVGVCLLAGATAASADDQILLDRESMKFQIETLRSTAARADKLLAGAKSEPAKALAELQTLEQQLDDLGRKIAAAKAVDSVGNAGAKGGATVVTSAIYVTPIGEASLRIVMERVKAAALPGEKMRVLRDATSNAFFVADQCIRVLGAFANVDDRIQALELLMPRLLDRQNSQKILVVFPFVAERERARAAMARIFATGQSPLPTSAP